MKRLFGGLVLTASLWFVNPVVAQAQVVISVSCGDTCPGSAVVFKDVYVKNVKTWVIKNPHQKLQKIEISLDSVNEAVEFTLGDKVFSGSVVITLAPGESRVLLVQKKDAVVNLVVKAIE